MTRPLRGQQRLRRRLRQRVDDLSEARGPPQGRARVALRRDAHQPQRCGSRRRRRRAAGLQARQAPVCPESSGRPPDRRRSSRRLTVARGRLKFDFHPTTVISQRAIQDFTLYSDKGRSCPCHRRRRGAGQGLAHEGPAGPRLRITERTECCGFSYRARSGNGTNQTTPRSSRATSRERHAEARGREPRGQRRRGPPRRQGRPRARPKARLTRSSHKSGAVRRRRGRGQYEVKVSAAARRRGLEGSARTSTPRRSTASRPGRAHHLRADPRRRGGEAAAALRYSRPPTSTRRRRTSRRL